MRHEPRICIDPSAMNNEERFTNIEFYLMDLEKRFCQYAEDHPKSSDQWTEERIRALEIQCAAQNELIATYSNAVIDLQIQTEEIKKRIYALRLKIDVANNDIETDADYEQDLNAKIKLLSTENAMQHALLRKLQQRISKLQQHIFGVEHG